MRPLGCRRVDLALIGGFLVPKNCPAVGFSFDIGLIAERHQSRVVVPSLAITRGFGRESVAILGVDAVNAKPEIVLATYGVISRLGPDRALGPSSGAADPPVGMPGWQCSLVVRAGASADEAAPIAALCSPVAIFKRDGLAVRNLHQAREAGGVIGDAGIDRRDSPDHKMFVELGGLLPEVHDLGWVTERLLLGRFSV